MDKTKTKAPEPTDDNFQTILIALVAVVVTILIFLIYKRFKSTKSVVLITGLCDSGKTLLFSRLLHNKYIYTQTSIKENSGSYSANGSILQLVDIPGHERLREKFFDQYKAISKGIIYVIDSQTFVTDIRDIAEFLYNILTDPLLVNTKLNLLVLCNKQDLPKVKGSTLIKSQLEKELNALRITKSSQLESVDPKAKKNAMLGRNDQPFTFGSVSGLNIDFIEAYNCMKDNNDDCNIGDLKKWLVKIA